MKLQTLMFIGIALCAMGCAEKEQAMPEQTDEAQTTTPAPVEEPATEAPAAEAEAPEAGSEESMGSDAFLQHMHAHAEMLDDINLALADGDLEGAMTPAYWLSRHDDVGGISPEWVPFVSGMREAASAVEEASDVETAGVAAQRINVNCQGCHAASGVGVD